MQKFKRLFSVFLACAIMLGMVAAPIPAEAAATNYELVFQQDIKKLTAGAAFDPATADTVTSANKGDIVVLTVAFNNKSTTDAKFQSFGFTVQYDSTRLSPYVGTAPFNSPSTYFAINTTAFNGWMAVSNPGSGNVMVSGFTMSMTDAVASPGETVLGYMAFQVKDDAEDGNASFTFSAGEVGDYPLSDFQTSTLTIGNGSSSTDPADPGDDEPETPSHVTDHELVFHQDIKKLTADTAFDPATAQTVTSANKGDIVVLTVAFNNKSTTDAKFQSFGFTVQYDSTRLSPYVGTAPFNSPSTYFAINATAFNGWMAVSNPGSGNVMVSGFTMSMTDAVASPGETVLGYMAFQVKEDAQDGNASFTFSAGEVGDYDLTSFLSRKLYIGVPALTVTVTPATDTVTVPESGSETKTFAAEVKEGGTTVANPTVTWTWDGGEINGVTFSNGTVTVTSDAAITEGKTVTVTATYENASGGTASGSAKLTIQPKGGEEKLVATIDEDGTEKTAVTVEEGKAASFTATVKTAGGAAVTGAKWSVTKKDGSSADGTGVSVNEDTGEVTVTDTAQPGDYLIIAEKDGQKAEVSLKVGDESEPAAAKIEVTLNPASVTVSADADVTVTATAQAKDAGENNVTTPELTWSLNAVPPTDDVKINADTGEVTVSKDANITEQTAVTVTATAKDNDSLTGSATLTISPKSGGSSDALVATVNDNGTEKTAVTAESGKETKFTAQVKTAGGGAVTGAKWSVTKADGSSAENSGVTVNENTGEVTVSANAQAGNYLIIAEKDGQTAQVSLQVSGEPASDEAIVVDRDRASVEIPGVNSPNASAQFRAIDKTTGNTITSGITWSLSEEIRGVSIHPYSGTLTVENDAKRDITDLTGKTVVVTATRDSDGKSASASIVVRRADPVLSIVTLSFEGQSVSTNANGDTLSVRSDGQSSKIVSALAQDQYGENVDGAVEWSLLSGGSGLNISGSGVSLSGSATYAASVIVGITAHHGTYIVQAKQGERAPTAQMTVARADEYVNNLTISDGSTSIEVPGKGAAANNSDQFNVLVQNQYGEPMSDETVEWNVYYGDPNSKVPGVTISDGVVTVSYEAKGTVTDTQGLPFTVSATSGNITKTKSIQIRRAAPELNFITLDGKDAAQSVNVAIDGTQDETIRGEAWDQYESPITATGWSVAPIDFTDDGKVTVNSATGVITVSKNASPGGYSVTASRNGLTVGPNSFRVSRGTPDPERLIISEGQSSVYIPGDGQAPTETRPFVATVKDQFGSDITGRNVNWSITDESGALVSGITISSDGVVSVANEVKTQITAGTWKTMVVNASCEKNSGAVISANPAYILVRRANPILSQVRIETETVENNVAVINYPGTGTATVAATALDQYGDAFTNSAMSWDFASLNKTGVSVNASTGTISVTAGAVEGVVHTLTAKYDTQAPSANFRVSKAASGATVLNRVVIDYPSVTVNASASQGAGARATAQNPDGQQITQGILWEVYPDDKGVNINRQTGEIQVSPSAEARTYVVTATPDSAFGVVTGSAKHADFTVNSAASATVTLSRVALLKNPLTVNGISGDNTQAVAYGSDENTLSGVTWSISPSDGGVSVGENSGSIIAYKDATAGSYIITASYKGDTASATLAVLNETAPAELALVTLNPQSVELNGSADRTSQAAALTSNNQTVSGASWTILPDDQGVTINANNGAITIPASAPAGNYVVTASYNGVNKSETLRVSRASTTVTLDHVTVTPSSVALDGAKSATATAIGSDNNPITTGVTWSVSSTDGEGVSIDSSTGAIVVSESAKTGTYTITATRGTESRSQTFSVTSVTPPAPSPYAVTVTPATASVNGSAARTAQAVATADGASVTGGIVWSVEPTGRGVTIDPSSGAVAVEATAAGGTYTVRATRGDYSASAELSVTNATPASSVSLVRVSLNLSTVTLDGSNAQTSTATAIGSDTNPITTGVTWSVEPTGRGVTIDESSGAISIAATALTGTYAVSATYGTTTRSAELTVNGVVDVEYEPTTVETANLDTPLKISYTGTGVKSSADQSSIQAAALSLADVQTAVADAGTDTDTKVVISVKITPVSYDANSLKLSVTPVYKVTKGGQTIKEGELSELDAPVTVSFNVPDGFDATFAKHTHTNASTNAATTYYEPISYSMTDGARVANWTQQYFSEVELTKNAVTVSFNAAGGSPAPASQTIAVGGTVSLPTVARSGYRFVAWYRADGSVASATTTFTTDETLTARWTTSGGSSSGGGGGGGGSSSGGSSSGGSSSGGSSSSKVEYTVTLSSGTGGSLSASAKKATSGTTITVVPTPNAGYALDTLSVTTRAGRSVDVSSSAGSYSFEMPAASVTVTASFTRSASSNTDNGNSGNSGTSGNGGNTTPVNPYPTISFVDMPTDNFFYTAVRWAVERGITNGTTATTFSPNQACTRAQMVMFLWRSQGMPMPSSNYSPFVDVDPGANYYTAMLWAVERGITNGTTATTFEPYSPCTRAQMVMFLWRVAGRPTPTQTTCPFTDITVGENYYIPMLWALERGITNGTTATTFSPYQACTRAQMVMFLYRYLGRN